MAMFFLIFLTCGSDGVLWEVLVFYGLFGNDAELEVEVAKSTPWIESKNFGHIDDLWRLNKKL